MINNKQLFECLCSDLGVMVSTSWSYQELDSLKNRLLKLAEAEFPYYATDAYLESVHKVFEPKGQAFTVYSLRDVHQGGFKVLYQLLCWGLKIRKPHTKQQEEDYVKKFLQIEKGNRAYRVDRACPVTRFARSLCRRTFCGLDLRPSTIGKWCRHGPGATFDGEVGSDKNVFILPPDQLQRYASWDLFFPNESWAAHAADLFDSPVANPEGQRASLAASQESTKWYKGTSWSRKRFIEARLTLVPKTFKGPRGVFISPKEAMFWQLAQDEALKRHCEGTWIGRCYSPKSQDPSRESAYKASYSRWSATLDLSDASDRVTLQLVSHLFHRLDYLSLARTRPCFVWLPDGSRHKLSMFGPMGDGKTFPVLTIICVLLSVSAIAIALAGRDAVPTKELVERASYGVRVFGDDIIVPSEFYTCVVEALEAHNLKVNVDKSFSKGSFRESCGMDAYRGVDVTPIRQKVDLSDNGRLRHDALEGLVELHNAAVVKGFERLSTTLRAIITRRWHGKVGLTTDHRSNPHALLTLERSGVARCHCARKGQYRVHPWETAGEAQWVKPERYSKCMWCGSFGLISQLNSLHVHWRLNTDLHRLEQQVLVPEPVNYGFEGDSWWNAAYALWPKQQRYPEFPEIGTRKRALGSEAQWEQWDAACRAMHIRNCVEPGGGLRLQWVPLF